MHPDYFHHETWTIIILLRCKIEFYWIIQINFNSPKSKNWAWKCNEICKRKINDNDKQATKCYTTEQSRSRSRSKFSSHRSSLPPYHFHHGVPLVKLFPGMFNVKVAAVYSAQCRTDVCLLGRLHRHFRRNTKYIKNELPGDIGKPDTYKCQGWFS